VNSSRVNFPCLIIERRVRIGRISEFRNDYAQFLTSIAGPDEGRVASLSLVDFVNLSPSTPKYRERTTLFRVSHLDLNKGIEFFMCCEEGLYFCQHPILHDPGKTERDPSVIQKEQKCTFTGESGWFSK
jgi:hypothetical protein